MSLDRYLAAACQLDRPNPADRSGIAAGVDHQLAMIERAVVGYRPFGDVRLVVFPEFSHAAPIYATVAEIHDRLAVPIPNEHTDRYHAAARGHGVSGARLQHDLPDRPRRPAHEIPQGESLAAVGAAHEPARSPRLP
jgi:predicted amidohydrolase